MKNYAFAWWIYRYVTQNTYLAKRITEDLRNNETIVRDWIKTNLLKWRRIAQENQIVNNGSDTEIVELTLNVFRDHSK